MCVSDRGKEDRDRLTERKKERKREIVYSSVPRGKKFF